MFVEDPGPAHYVASLPGSLAENGWHSVVYATGLARNVLLNRQIPFIAVDEFATPESILHQLQPRLLLTGTSESPDSLGLQLIRAAQQYGIVTAAFIDAGMNSEYRFRGNSNEALFFAPDWILVPDDWTRHDFIRIGARADRTVICGHPQYDYVLSLRRTWTAEDRNNWRRQFLPAVADRQQVIVFLSEGSERVSLLSPIPPLQEYTLQGWGNRTGRTEIILEEFLMAAQTLQQRPYLVLRLHPKDHQNDFHIYTTDFDHIDYELPPLELVFCADLVVGMTSMLLMEAALLGRQTLSILPRVEEMYWLSGVRDGMIPHVTTRDALQRMLNDFAQSNPIISPVRNNHMPTLGAAQRIIELISSLMKKN